MKPTHRRQRRPVTLILVSEDEHAPKSWRIPTWLAPIAVGYLVCALMLSSYFVLDYVHLKAENQTLRKERYTETLRQRDMRSTILVQQEQVEELSGSVAALQTQLVSADQLVQHVRSLLKLGPAQPLHPQQETISYQKVAQEEPAWSEQVGAGIGGINWSGPQQQTSWTGSGMFLATSRKEDIAQMKTSLPALVKGLQALDGETQARLERLGANETEGVQGQEIAKQLRLQAVAPHGWPTDNHFVISPFGYRILNGKEDFHTGVDFPVWYGTKVHATKKGTVSSAGWKEGYGWVVEIEHEMDFSTVYAHNSSLLVEKGDKVKAGDIVALSGASGWTTGPHMHYEIRIDGIPVNPAPYFDIGQTTQ